MRTNRGAEKIVSTSRYETTSRAGRGRELLKNGTLTGVVRPPIEAPAPLPEDTGESGDGKALT